MKMGPIRTAVTIKIDIAACIRALAAFRVLFLILRMSYKSTPFGRQSPKIRTRFS